MSSVHPAPKIASNEGVRETLVSALGDNVLASEEKHGEIILTVKRDSVEDLLKALRDDHAYQQLMEIAGVDYPSRPVVAHRILLQALLDQGVQGGRGFEVDRQPV